MNFPTELRRVPKMLCKPEQPSFGERVQLSYYFVEATNNGFELYNINRQRLHQSSSWEDLLNELGAWPKQGEKMELPLDTYRKQFVELVNVEVMYAKEVMDELQDGFDIENQDEYNVASEILSEVKGRKKALEEERKKATGPLNQAREVIYGWFREPIRYYDEAEAIIKNSMKEFYLAQQRRQQKALEQASEASMANRKEEAEEAMQLVAASEVEKVDGIQIREDWTYEVVDFKSVPKEFLMINDRAVREYIKKRKGEAKIPGIKIIKGVIVASRSAKDV